MVAATRLKLQKSGSRNQIKLQFHYRGETLLPKFDSRGCLQRYPGLCAIDSPTAARPVASDRGNPAASDYTNFIATAHFRHERMCVCVFSPVFNQLNRQLARPEIRPMRCTHTHTHTQKIAEARDERAVNAFSRAAPNLYRIRTHIHTHMFGDCVTSAL